MKDRWVKGKWKRLCALLLAATLLIADKTFLYAAETGSGQPVLEDGEENTQDEAGTEPEQENPDVTDESIQQPEEPGESTPEGIEDAVSGGNAGEETGEDVTGEEGDSDADDETETVSGGDADVPGRLPEQFYEEEKPEDYGTLVSYDAYSRTYHVDGNRYVTVIGNDGATYIDEDGSLQAVDNTLMEQTVSTYGMFGDGTETSYINRANDYTVLLPQNIVERR